MTSYTEEYLKEKLSEKLKAVHVVSPSLSLINEIQTPLKVKNDLEKEYANKCQKTVRTI